MVLNQLTAGQEHHVITFLVTEGSKPAEILCQLSHVFGEQTVAYLSMSGWCKHLRGHKFHMDDKVNQKGLQWFSDQPKEFYAARIQKLTARLIKCEAVVGDCVNK